MKKLLAVMMAFGMIVCMAAIAFAADEPHFTMDVIKSEDGKTLVATLMAHDYIGLNSGKVVVTYEGLTLDHIATGAQAKAVNDTVDNRFELLPNSKQAGKIICGFTFLESLWTAEQFAANAAEDKTVEINTKDFDLFSVYFKVDEDAAASKIAIDVTSKSVDASDKKQSSDNPEFKDDYILVKEGETTTEPCSTPLPCETTTDCCCPDKSSCETTECCCPDKSACKETTTNCCCGQPTNSNPPKTDGGRDTGDNGMVAIMAGVMALAGAAFVVTKKRK